MFARRQPVVEAMDRAAELFWKPWFWLFRVQPFAAIGAQKRQHSYRYLPLCLLLACVIGLGLMIAGWRHAALLIITNLVLMATGQIHARSPVAPLAVRDEREIALFRLGHLWGLFTVMLLAVGGCFYFAFAEPITELNSASAATLLTGRHLWFPANPLDWFVLAVFLVNVEINVAVLISSWSLPRSDPAED